MAAVTDMVALVVQGTMTPSRIAIKTLNVMKRKPSQKISFPANMKVVNWRRERHITLGIFSSSNFFLTFLYVLAHYTQLGLPDTFPNLEKTMPTHT